MDAGRGVIFAGNRLESHRTDASGRFATLLKNVRKTV
jgi:hypothetical protein